MPKLVLTLDTETGHIDYDYPEGECLPPVIINGSVNSHLKGCGEATERVVTGWYIGVQVGEHPEEQERQRHMGRLLMWRDRQREVLTKEVDDDGVSLLDISLRCRLEGAIELAETLLKEMGYQEGPKESVTISEKEPSGEQERQE